MKNITPQILLEECLYAEENIKNKNYIDKELKWESVVTVIVIVIAILIMKNQFRKIKSDDNDNKNNNNNNWIFSTIKPNSIC